MLKNDEPFYKKPKYISIGYYLFAVLLTGIFICFSPSRNQEFNEKVLELIIIASSIFSAIVITYLFSKLLNLRQERLLRRPMIIELTNKLLNYKRIAKILFNNKNFWHKVVLEFDNSEFKDINYFEFKEYINSHQRTIYTEKEKRIQALLKTNSFEGFHLYLEVKTLSENLQEIWEYNFIDNEKPVSNYYSYISIEQCNLTGIGYNIYDAFKNNPHDYVELFNLPNLTKPKCDKILNLAKTINHEKFNVEFLDESVLADIGSEIQNNVIPELLELTFLNNLWLYGVSGKIFNLLKVIMIAGIILPLIVFNINSDLQIFSIITYILSSIIICTFISLVFKIDSIIEEEIIIDKEII